MHELEASSLDLKTGTDRTERGWWLMFAQKAEASMTFNVFVKREDGAYVAHCLELDIVTTGDSPDQVERDLIDLVRAQVNYAFANNNLDYLYRPAPREVWQEFYQWHCKGEEKGKNNCPIKKSPIRHHITERRLI